MASPSRLMMGALAVALALGQAVAQAATDKPAPAEAKHAEDKPADAKAADTKAAGTKAGETKAAAPKAGEAKAGEAKAGETKPPVEKADGKAKDAKPEGDKTGDGEPAAEKPVRPKPFKKTLAKEPPRPPGEGPSPASPPPMTMGGLRDEVRRETAAGKIDPGASPRTKVEQMLSEIVKTREALHTETLRLEGMMAQETPEGAAPGAAPGALGGGGATAGAKPAKHPLDILAKALRAIKPEQAAPIVSRLDKRLAATVLQRMPPVDAGKIMGAMKPDTAAELATQIAMRVPGSEKGEEKK